MTPTNDSVQAAALPAPRGRVGIAIGASAFAVLTLISAAQIYSLRRASNESITVPVALAFGAATWIVWALAAPLILALGRRFDFRHRRRAISLVVHLAAMTLFLVPATLVLVAVGMALFSPGEAFPWSELPRQVFASSRFQMGVLIYVAIVALGRGVDAWTRVVEREAMAERLRAQATAARLETLASRLQPHFLFNALHTVGALVDEDPGRARRLLSELGDLLRDVLTAPEAIEVPLEEELRLLRRYLAIEETRFADRLRVELAAPGTLARVPVPRLLLQPLVENALRHGIAPRAAGGMVRVSVASDHATMILSVANDGEPLRQPIREGLGLATTRERLATRYAGRATLGLESRDDWVVATVRIPLAERAG